jgi:hypothetical protein
MDQNKSKESILDLKNSNESIVPKDTFYEKKRQRLPSRTPVDFKSIIKLIKKKVMTIILVFCALSIPFLLTSEFISELPLPDIIIKSVVPIHTDIRESYVLLTLPGLMYSYITGVSDTYSEKQEQLKQDMEKERLQEVRAKELTVKNAKAYEAWVLKSDVVTIKSRPSGAQIYINGHKSNSVTPAPLRVEKNKNYKVYVVLNGKKSNTMISNPSYNSTITVNIK